MSVLRRWAMLCPGLGRRLLSRHFLVAAALALGLGAASCTSQSGSSLLSSSQPTRDSNGIRPGTQFTPLAASVLTTPTAVKGTDDKSHLAYELLLTNSSDSTVTLNQIEVRDARTHLVLLSLTGPALTDPKRGVVKDLGATAGDEGLSDPETPASSIPSSTTVIVWLDVPVSGQGPPQLEHHIVASKTDPKGGPPFPVDIVVANVATGRGKPVVLDPPVGNGLWYASEGCCSDDTHHRRGLATINGQLAVAQRFALDWFLLDDQHRTLVGDPKNLMNYLSYGKPVLAVADGTVVDVQDGLPDGPAPDLPTPAPPIENTVGNHVTMSIGNGLFALYGHFKPNSVFKLGLRVGQHVHRGQVLGQIGDSGFSSTPHLHFQIQTTPQFFPTDSPPYVFDRFTLVGQITQRIWDDNIGAQPTDVLPFAPAPPGDDKRHELPLDRTVVSFSGQQGQQGQQGEQGEQGQQGQQGQQ